MWACKIRRCTIKRENEIEKDLFVHEILLYCNNVLMEIMGVVFFFQWCCLFFPHGGLREDVWVSNNLPLLCICCVSVCAFFPKIKETGFVLMFTKPMDILVRKKK